MTEEQAVVCTWWRRARSTAALVAVLIAGLVAASAPSAVADTAPPDPTTPTTVAADALPTVQINGVVWAQVVVGNRVYVTGSFTSARPAGSPVGTGEVARSNILAFDLTTGALITSWAPSLNAQGMAIAASPDGSRIYVVGDFTSAGGSTRNRVAAFDATTGALITSFNAGTNARARALAVTADAVYVGGNFTTAGGQPRTRLAAFSPTNGALLPWAPTAEQEVMSMTAPPGAGKVVVGGRFTQLNGSAWYGMGALSTTGTGATLPWAATGVVRNAGANAAIWYLTSDASGVYGTGYTFGAGGNLENAFSAAASDGALRWVAGCLGDTYGVAPAGPVAYQVGHAHDCAQIGWFPEQSPRTWQRALATTSTQGAGGRTNSSGPFQGRPAPEALHWLPTIPAGTFTGQSQGPWVVSATRDYVVLGGEFPSVNGTAQQGLARFAVRSVAPNRQGPQGQGDLVPTLSAPATATARATFRAAWDRDNRRLTYELLRGPTVGGAVVVASLEADSAWWTRPQLTLTDTSAPGGSQTYRIRVRDPLGNAVTGNPATVTVTGGTPPPGGGTFATDAFERTVSSGLGAATTGGSWTTSGTAADFSVGNGVANFRAAAPGAQRAGFLGSVSQNDADVTVAVRLDKAPAGGPTYVSVIGRRVGSDDYRAKLRFNEGGAVSVQLMRLSGGTETVIGSTVTVPGVTYTAGQVLRVRMQAGGTGPTTLAAKVWPQGSTEPGTFPVTGSDSTAALQASGSVGLLSYVSGAATNTPVAVSFDDLAGGPRPTP